MGNRRRWLFIWLPNKVCWWHTTISFVQLLLFGRGVLGEKERKRENTTLDIHNEENKFCQAQISQNVKNMMALMFETTSLI